MRSLGKARMPHIYRDWSRSVDVRTVICEQVSDICLKILRWSMLQCSSPNTATYRMRAVRASTDTHECRMPLNPKWS